jgi:hypothetical protein
VKPKSKTQLSMTKCSLVEVRNAPKEFGSKFYEWMLANEIYTIRGTVASGPGFFVGCFHEVDAERVWTWIKENT